MYGLQHQRSGQWRITDGTLNPKYHSDWRESFVFTSREEAQASKLEGETIARLPSWDGTTGHKSPVSRR